MSHARPARGRKPELLRRLFECGTAFDLRGDDRAIFKAQRDGAQGEPDLKGASPRRHQEVGAVAFAGFKPCRAERVKAPTVVEGAYRAKDIAATHRKLLGAHLPESRGVDPGRDVGQVKGHG